MTSLETLAITRSDLLLYPNYTLQNEFCQLLYLNNLTFTSRQNRAQGIWFEEKQTNK
jgi:hypothetical protein